MRRGGRVWPTGGLPRLLCIYACIALTAGSDYGIPIEIKLWDTGRTPLAHMVDVTNGFGLKVLAEHNFLNDNNIAFSPYGLMGILVALFEGVNGESSYQIQRGMQLPWNRNVMRIGFRDIHRTLKTYFIPEEGFLAGLALNNENVTFNDEYKKILRFYGFELENDQLPTLPPQKNNNTNESTSKTPIKTTIDSSGSTTPAPPMVTIAMGNVTGREDLSTNPTTEKATISANTETINEIDIRGPTPTTSESSSSVSTSESITTTVPTTSGQVASTAAEPTEITTTSTTIPISTTTTTTTVIPTTVPDTTTTTTTTMTTTTTTTPTTVTITPTMPSTPEISALTTASNTETTAQQMSSTATTSQNNEQTVNNEIEFLTSPETVPNTVTESTTADTSTTTTTTITTNGNTEVSDNTATSTSEMQQTEQTSATSNDMTILPDSTTTMANETTLETLERRKKSIVDFIFTNPPYVDDYLIYKSYDIGQEPSKPNFHGDNMFLANGLKSIQVTYMHYNSILEHAYLPHLEASALRLPLDSERYYLLVVLPSRGGAAELGRLLTRMARESDLRDVYAALRPRRVRATVPSFTVKGHVTLTTDLQKLGIHDVFEPRQRDFTPMTPQPGVYVRSIEQAVSVAIRKYRPDEQKKNRYVTNRQPIHFSATYPFLYFVMDASIHVALMAGKMVDPLNSRIL